MEEGVTPQVIVDESWHDAHLGQAQPQRDVLDPVLHEQGHSVALPVHKK